MDEKFIKRLQSIFEDAVAEAFSKVALASAAATGAGQSTAGAESATGGVSAQQGSSQQHTGASHKNDVSAPELIESYNTSMLQDVAHMSKVNARTHDVVSGALSLGTLMAATCAGAQMGNVTTQQNEEYSNRKKTGVLDFVVVGDAAEESAKD
jgi:hypothetical protein